MTIYTFAPAVSGQWRSENASLASISSTAYDDTAQRGALLIPRQARTRDTVVWVRDSCLPRCRITSTPGRATRRIRRKNMLAGRPMYWQTLVCAHNLLPRPRLEDLHSLQMAVTPPNSIPHALHKVHSKCFLSLRTPVLLRGG